MNSISSCSGTFLCFPNRQGSAKEFAQVGQHLVRLVSPVLPHQDDDCVQGVEKEMRMQLNLERVQVSLQELSF
jgi:hypothetical protein